MKFIELTPIGVSRPVMLNLKYVSEIARNNEGTRIEFVNGNNVFTNCFEESYGQVAAMLCVHTNVSTATYTVNGVTKYDT